jgi:hypothetical protein
MRKAAGHLRRKAINMLTRSRVANSRHTTPGYIVSSVMTKLGVFMRHGEILLFFEFNNSNYSNNSVLLNRELQKIYKRRHYVVA